MKLAEAVDKKLTKSIEKTFIGVIFAGFIILTVLWLPTFIDNSNHIKNKESIEVNTKDSEVDMSDIFNNSFSARPIIVQEENKQMKEVVTPTTTENKDISAFNFKETITWFIGVVQSFLIILLTIKKVFGKGV